MDENKEELLPHKNIWQLSGDYLDLLANIEELDGELTDELAEQYEITKENFETKVTNYCKLVSKVTVDNASIDGSIEGLKGEIARLENIKKVNETKIKNLKKVLLYATKTFGYKGKSDNMKLDLLEYKLFTKISKKLQIDDNVNLLDIDDKFKKYKVDFSNLSNTMHDELATLTEDFITTHAIIPKVTPVIDKEIIKEILEKQVPAVDLFTDNAEEREAIVEEINEVKMFADLIEVETIHIK